MPDTDNAYDAIASVIADHVGRNDDEFS